MTSESKPAIALPGKVLSVHDGDTVTVRVEFDIPVRLLDCWAAEVTGSEKPAGLRAKQHLEQLCLNRQVLLTVPFGGNDFGDSFTFGRTLGRLSVDGRDISEQMVKDGYATKTKRKD